MQLVFWKLVFKRVCCSAEKTHGSHGHTREFLPQTCLSASSPRRARGATRAHTPSRVSVSCPPVLPPPRAPHARASAMPFPGQVCPHRPRPRPRPRASPTRGSCAFTCPRRRPPRLSGPRCAPGSRAVPPAPEKIRRHPGPGHRGSPARPPALASLAAGSHPPGSPGAPSPQGGAAPRRGRRDRAPQGAGGCGAGAAGWVAPPPRSARPPLPLRQGHGPAASRSRAGGVSGRRGRAAASHAPPPLRRPPPSPPPRAGGSQPGRSLLRSGCRAGPAERAPSPDARPCARLRGGGHVAPGGRRWRPVGLRAARPRRPAAPPPHLPAPGGTRPRSRTLRPPRCARRSRPGEPVSGGREEGRTTDGRVGGWMDGGRVGTWVRGWVGGWVRGWVGALLAWGGVKNGFPVFIVL